MHRSRVSVRIVTCLALALVVAAAASSCNSSSSTGLAQSCSLNSDCNSPLACVFSRCHEACQVSSDCPSGERCVHGGTGGADGSVQNVCQLPAEATCATSPLSCAGTQVCALDQQCRMPCQTTEDCPGGGQLCLPQGATSLCYSAANPIDKATLVYAGDIGSDGGVIVNGEGGTGGPDSATNTGSDASGDSMARPQSDAGGDSTVSPRGDGGIDGATPPICGDAMALPNGTCGFCVAGACTHGTCVNGPQDYTCQCYAGYSGTGTKTCTLSDACLANAGACQSEYPCQDIASPGVACLGQFATWTMPDAQLDNGVIVAKAAPQYSAQGGIVTDTVTTLMWEQAAAADCSGADAGTCSYAAAQTYCKNLNLGTYTDWRVPTKIEVESLLDCTPSIAPYVNQAAFPGTPAAEFWSASTYVGTTNQWTTDFSNCWTSNSRAPTESHAVRCVRGTGITSSTPAQHYTITAGAIDAGVLGGEAGPVEDTVTDNWTGLTWERAFGDPVLQAQATSRCSQLGFRVPTEKELLTLVDPTRVNPATDPAAFPGTPSHAFWSSTSNFLVDFTVGGTYLLCCGGTVGYIRCVK